MSKWFWSTPEQSKDEFDSFMFLKYFTVDNIMALSWKKRYAFLHVIEDILGVFDELHVKPYLDLLMGCVVRILWSCTSIIDSGLSVVETHSSLLMKHEKGGGAENQITVICNLHISVFSMFLVCFHLFFRSVTFHNCSVICDIIVLSSVTFDLLSCLVLRVTLLLLLPLLSWCFLTA